MENRYNDIENLISTIDILLSEVKEKDILEDIRYLKYKYEDEKEELEIKIAEEQEREWNEFEKEYERSVM